MRWAALGMMLAGCLQPKSQICEGGGETWVCPAELSCAAAPTYCGTPQEVGACDGKMDRDPCMTNLVPSGLCVANVCEPCSNDIAGCRYVGWNPMTSPSSDVLSAVAFVQPGEAYAAGDNGTMLHYLQAGWEVDARFPVLTGVGVTGLVVAGDKVYAMTNSSQVYVLANAAWTKLPDPSLPFYKAMWAAPSGEVVLAGANGHVATFDGATWTETMSGTATFNAVWGQSATDVYAVGTGATIVHYDGAAWTPVANPGTGALGAVWAGGGQVFAAGTSIVHATGGAFATTPAPIAVTVRGLWGSAGDDVFAVGDAGAILHWDGVSWTQMIASTTALHGVGGSGAAEVVAVGDGGVISRYTGAGWAMPNSPATTLGLRDLWAGGPDDVIAVGAEGAFHLHDTTWAHELTSPTLAVTGRGPSDALVAATNTAQHWDGASWTALAPGQIGSVADLWATPATYFAVSDYLSTFDGSTWTTSTIPIASSKGLWVAPSGRVWVAGAGVQHLDGMTLSTDLATGTFNGIWGAGETDVFAVGLGDIHHYDGTAWTAMTVPTTNPLTGVWGRASDDVFAVGSTNTVLHYHAGLWQTFATPFTGDLTSVTGAGSSIYASSADGKVYRLIDSAP
ncbi:MAG: hypothetical protein ABI467_07070 [Kofleriaceae bacterium]